MDTKLKQVDVLPAVQYYMTELGLHDLLDKHVPNTKGFEIRPAQVLCMMIMNIVVAAKPLYKMDEWLLDYLDGKAEDIDNANKYLEQLLPKLNEYYLKSKEQIEKAIKQACKGTGDFLCVEMMEEEQIEKLPNFAGKGENQKANLE